MALLLLAVAVLAGTTVVGDALALADSVQPETSSASRAETESGTTSLDLALTIILAVGAIGSALAAAFSARYTKQSSRILEEEGQKQRDFQTLQRRSDYYKGTVVMPAFPIIERFQDDVNENLSEHVETLHALGDAATKREQRTEVEHMTEGFQKHLRRLRTDLRALLQAWPNPELRQAVEDQTKTIEEDVFLKLKEAELSLNDTTHDWPHALRTTTGALKRKIWERDPVLQPIRAEANPRDEPSPTPPPDAAAPS